MAAGLEAGLKDHYHCLRESGITEAEKAWVLNLACTKPKDHGLAAEFWSLAALASYTREHAPADGHASLANAVRAAVWRILNGAEIKPHKIEYYLERRDELFKQRCAKC